MTLQIEPTDVEGTINQASGDCPKENNNRHQQGQIKNPTPTKWKTRGMETRTKGRIHEQTDEETVRHNLQST